MATKEDILDAIAGMSVLELSELLKDFEEKFGGPATRVPLAALAALVHVTATFTVTRTTGGLIAYVLRWTWPVAVFATAVALLPLVDLLRRHRTPVVRIGRLGPARPR